MTEPTVAVSDASPLIALEQIGRLDLLPALFSAVVIPSAVADEAFGGAAVPSWLRVVSPAARIAGGARLGSGEQQAIALERELSAAWIVLDDLAARRLAAREGLRVIGTVGLLLAGKRRELIDAVRPFLDALDAQGFRLSSAVRTAALQAAGEADTD